MKLMQIALLWGVASFPTLAVAQELDWAVYNDDVYGCSLDYPRSVFSPDAEQAGEPQRFSSAEEDIYFRVMGAKNASGWTPREIRRRYLQAEMPGDITYERTKPEFLVLSGFRDKNIFYTKVAVSADRSVACILDITYPPSQKRRFDAIVTRMSHSFMVK
jgi:hypothetical protein